MAAVDLWLLGSERMPISVNSTRPGIGSAKRWRGSKSTKEKWAEAEIHRVAGEIALRSPVPDAARAQSYFTTALAIARRRQAKSWELRSATSYARLMRDQGRVRRSLRSARAGLRLVYRGLRHQGPEGGQGAARTNWPNRH